MSVTSEDKRIQRATFLISLYEKKRGQTWRKRSRKREVIYERYAVLSLVNKVLGYTPSSTDMGRFLSEYISHERTNTYHAIYTARNLMQGNNPPALLVECMMDAIECYKEAVDITPENRDVVFDSFDRDLDGCIERYAGIMSNSVMIQLMEMKLKELRRNEHTTS